MKFLGFRVRRFPLWLVIFNGLCAAAAFSILLASGLLVISPRTELVTARGVNLAAGREHFRRSAWRSLADSLRGRPRLEREALAREFGALCEPETIFFLKSCEAMGLGEAIAVEVERWESLAPSLWERGLGELDESSLSRDARSWRFRLLCWSVLWGDGLQRRIAIDELNFDAGIKSERGLSAEEIRVCAWAARRGPGLLPMESERLRTLLLGVSEPDWLRWREDVQFVVPPGLGRLRYLEGEMRVGIELDGGRYKELEELKGGPALLGRWLFLGPSKVSFRRGLMEREVLEAGLEAAREFPERRLPEWGELSRSLGFAATWEEVERGRRGGR